MDLNIYDLTKNMFAPLLTKVWFIINCFIVIVISAVISVIFAFFLSCQLNPKRIKKLGLREHLRTIQIDIKPFSFLRWVWVDYLRRNELEPFGEYGFTIYCGRQGSGKTVSMVDYLVRMKKEYPKLRIATNFKCNVATDRMTDWQDFYNIKNGEDGVIFAIDEIQAEYSSSSWKTFPETLLSQISMQRKQKIKIVATSQVYNRVAKQIREQAFSVVQCDTYLNRLTVTREYDADDYSVGSSGYIIKRGVRPLRKRKIVQSDELRETYDTDEVIERMKNNDFLPRNER